MKSIHHPLLAIAGVVGALVVLATAIFTYREVRELPHAVAEALNAPRSDAAPIA